MMSARSVSVMHRSGDKQNNRVWADRLPSVNCPPPRFPGAFAPCRDDPALGIDWDARDPIVSGHDQKNPLLSAIPAGDLPK